VLLKRRIAVITALVLGVISFGTIGYSVIEKWNIFDALYMTVITLSTVGYEEIHELSTPGRTFTITPCAFGRRHHVLCAWGGGKNNY